MLFNFFGRLKDLLKTNRRNRGRLQQALETGDYTNLIA